MATTQRISNTVRFLVAALAGSFDHRQQEVVGYLVEENRPLRAQLGSRRLRLTDDQRRRLAVRGQWSSGFEMLVLGVLVAAAAYASGAAVRALLT